ncbi:MAG TPA: hypothetical protein VLC09_04240 [Polyangiaceae bacterium]|nr:hypothetical protein [Polyangiaceae bacterium]
MVPRHDEVVFAEGGALRRSVWGEKSSAILRAEETPPERLAATDSSLFVLQRNVEGGSEISLFASGALKKIYETTSSIATLSAKDDRAFFVEAKDENFRIVSATRGGRAVFGPEHPGRTPAALAVSDSIYYYDGPRREVRRISLELDAEQVVASDVVCSPLHVADRVYCAFPGSITAIGLNNPSKVDLEVHARGPITALTTFEDRLLWIEDAGAERLVVKSLPLE